MTEKTHRLSIHRGYTRNTSNIMRMPVMDNDLQPPYTSFIYEVYLKMAN